MSDQIHNLTVNSDSNTLLYVTKFIDLLENHNLYENGEETLKEIKDKLNLLTCVKPGASSNSDDDVGYGVGSDMREVLHYKPWNIQH